ncbi:MAG: hypothetical protein ACYCO9_04295 [Streptosporangiaceae bacterium]
MLLGIWGGFIPLVGPYARFGYTPDHAWAVTSGRIWLEIVPAAVTVAGGLLLLATRTRPAAIFGAVAALLGGAWFTVGTVIAPLWAGAAPAQGSPLGGTTIRMFEQISFFPGLGVVIVALAAIAIGRLSVVSLRDAQRMGPAYEADSIESTDAEQGSAQQVGATATPA